MKDHLQSSVAASLPGRGLSSCATAVILSLPKDLVVILSLCCHPEPAEGSLAPASREAAGPRPSRLQNAWPPAPCRLSRPVAWPAAAPTYPPHGPRHHGPPCAGPRTSLRPAAGFSLAARQTTTAFNVPDVVSKAAKKALNAVNVPVREKLTTVGWIGSGAHLTRKAVSCDQNGNPPVGMTRIAFCRTRNFAGDP